jgi:hypothetical protein
MNATSRFGHDEELCGVHPSWACAACAWIDRGELIEQKIEECAYDRDRCFSSFAARQKAVRILFRVKFHFEWGVDSSRFHQVRPSSIPESGVSRYLRRRQ